jgi:hypothetical protein
MFNKDPKEDYRIDKLTELSLKGRTDAHLRHVCNQWGITGFKQNNYIKKVNEKVRRLSS